MSEIYDAWKKTSNILNKPHYDRTDEDITKIHHTIVDIAEEVTETLKEHKWEVSTHDSGCSYYISAHKEPQYVSEDEAHNLSSEYVNYWDMVDLLDKLKSVDLFNFTIRISDHKKGAGGAFGFPDADISYIITQDDIS